MAGSDLLIKIWVWHSIWAPRYATQLYSRYLIDLLYAVPGSLEGGQHNLAPSLTSPPVLRQLLVLYSMYNVYTVDQLPVLVNKKKMTSTTTIVSILLQFYFLIDF